MVRVSGTFFREEPPGMRGRAGYSAGRLDWKPESMDIHESPRIPMDIQYCTQYCMLVKSRYQISMHGYS